MGRRKGKGVQFFLAAACMLLLGIGMPARASEEFPESGQCGDNITWKYVKVDGNDYHGLELTGSGAMYNYVKKITYGEGGAYSYEAAPPWRGSLLSGIKLDDRITTIGDGAFGGVKLDDPKQNITVAEQAEGTLVLPENVTSIGKMAFWNAGFGRIYIGPNVRTVGEEAFYSCQVKELFVASKTLDFDKEERVLDLCTVKTIHAPKGSKAESCAKAHNIKFEEWDGADYGKTDYTVTLDAGEGAFPAAAQSSRYTVSADRKTASVELGVSAGSVPVPDIAPALAGKYFGGWYLGEEPFAFETAALTEDTTLTAKWLEEPAAPVLTIKSTSKQTVSLSWELRMDANLKEYRIWRADTADANFVQIEKVTGSVSYTDSVGEADIMKKQAYRYYIEAVYETGGAEKKCQSNEVSCGGMLINDGLITQTDGLYVGAKLLNENGEEISSLALHEGETSEELFFALVKKDGTTVLWQDARKDISGDVSLDYGLGDLLSISFPDNPGGNTAVFDYARFPAGYLYNESCTRLKGLKTTAGQLYLYVVGRPDLMMAIPVTVEPAEEGKEYPSYDKEGIVTGDLQAGLQILRDAVRERVNYAEVYIKKSACDPSIDAYNALRAQDKSDNPSGDPRGGYIPEWMEAELYDVNKNRPGMKPWEGDYAFYAWSQDQSNVDLNNPVTIYGEKYYKLELSIPRFSTTLEQEKAVDAKVAQLLSGRLAGAKGQSEYARAKAVYDYVSTSMHYDNSDPVYHYAYGGLCQGKATCMGFALSFQRLASELGLESKILMGLDSGAHTYNLVKIQGKYYYLDCSAKKFLKGKKSFSAAKLQDRYLSTAFQIYYMENIAENDYVAGSGSTLGGAAVRALTDKEIETISEGAYTGIADRTTAKYAVKDTVIQATPLDKAHPLKPVYDAKTDTQDYMLAFRLTVDQEKFDEKGTVKLFIGAASGSVFKKADSTLRDGYLDILCPIGQGDVSIAVDYDTDDEQLSKYEAVTYTLDVSKLVKASVRLSGAAKERTDALAETGIELSSPTVSYQNNDKEVTVKYDAVAYSSNINTENTGISEKAGNYVALRVNAPEAMLGTKALSASTAEFTQGAGAGKFQWGAGRTYLDCYCKMTAGQETILTVRWAGRDTQKQTIALQTSQDCYLETDGADADVAKSVAFNGLPSSLYVGQSQIADVKVTKAYEKDEVQLSFISDNSEVCSVNRITGEIKALRPGKATVTVRAAGLTDKGKVVSASKKITVKAVPAPSGVKITEIMDVSAAATWKKNTNSRWTEGYAVPYTNSLGGNAKAWKAAVETALSEAGLDSGMPENMTDEQRRALEAGLSEALCPGGTGKVMLARAQTTDGRLAWESGLRTDTSYVFYLRSMTENAAGEISSAGWVSGKIKTKMPVLTGIQISACNAGGETVAFHDSENRAYNYTDPTNNVIPAQIKYTLSTADSYTKETDVFKSPSYKSTNAKAVKVDGKGKLSLGGQAGTAEIYVTGKDSTGKLRESDRIRITVVKSLQQIKDKTTAVTLGQPISIQELVGCDVKGSADAFKLDRVDLAAMVDELETAGKDCFKVTYPDGEKEKAVITPFAYPVDTKSGERKKGASLTVNVKLYDKAGKGRQLVDTKTAVIKVNDMPAPSISRTEVLDNAVDITFKPSAVVKEIDGAQYYYTLTLTNRNTGETRTYRAKEEADASGDTFTCKPVSDKKGQISSYCGTINGLTSATGYEAVVTAHYLAEPAGDKTKQAEKRSGVKQFTTLKPVIAAENSMKVSLVSMSELWADANAAGREITHDTTITLTNAETYVLFADVGDYDRVLGADRIKWSVTSEPKGGAAIKASSDSYTAKLTLSRCGTVKVQAVSTLSKKVVCSFTVEVKPYQSAGGSAQAGGN